MAGERFLTGAVRITASLEFGRVARNRSLALTALIGEIAGNRFLTGAALIGARRYGSAGLRLGGAGDMIRRAAK